MPRSPAAGPVLTVRRAIAMLGLDGVRRAALGLRPWPGPLGEGAAQTLRALFDAGKRAGRVAQALRPAGYDAEVVHLVTLLQNLGRLIVGYHFPDELQQIRRLMQAGAGGARGRAGRAGHERAGRVVRRARRRHRGHRRRRGAALGPGRHRAAPDPPPAAGAPRRAPSTTTTTCCAPWPAAPTRPSTRWPCPGAAQAALRRVAQRYGRALHISCAICRTPERVGPRHAPGSRCRTKLDAERTPQDVGLKRPAAAARRGRVTSLTPGTGHNGWGCFVPDLTRLAALPCGEARRGRL